VFTIQPRLSPSSLRFTTEGAPALRVSAGIRALAATTDPAAISALLPMVAPLSTTALLPMSAPSSITQSSIVTLCPIVQSSPTVVAEFGLTCTTELS
jgi:hypothetical protein